MDTYIFTVYELVPGTRCTYAPTYVEESGETLEEAIENLSVKYPHHNIAPHLKGLYHKKVEAEVDKEPDPG